MDYLTAKQRDLIKSGNVIAFRNPRNFLEKWIEFWTGNYYHVGMIYVDPETNIDYIYEAQFRGICLTKLEETSIPFDIIETDIVFDKDLKRFADSLIGTSYSWANFILVCIGLNHIKFGYICSTLVGVLLSLAHENFKDVGLTPSRLINDLMNFGCRVTPIISWSNIKK